MNTYTIEKAKGMIGQVIPRIEVKLTKIFPRRIGEGQYGPWSFQDGEMSDGSGSMKIVFANHPDMSSKVNDTLVLKSMATKHGLKGVEVKEEEYQGKKTIQLRLTKTALVLGSGEEANVDFAPPSTREQAPEQPMPQKSSSAKPAKPTDVRLDMALVRNRMTQLSGLYALCYKSATEIEELENIVETDLKDVASCLFIQAVREGLADKMPIRSEKPKEEQEAALDTKGDEIPF